MSSRTGRPPTENPKSDRITVRLTEDQQEVLKDCAQRIGTSKSDIICRGLCLMKIEKDSREAQQLFDALVILDNLVRKNSPDVDKQIKQVESNFKWYLEALKKRSK